MHNNANAIVALSFFSTSQNISPCYIYIYVFVVVVFEFEFQMVHPQADLCLATRLISAPVIILTFILVDIVNFLLFIWVFLAPTRADFMNIMLIQIGGKH